MPRQVSPRSRTTNIKISSNAGDIVEFEGTWDPSKVYQPGEIVVGPDGNIYINTCNGNVNTPPEAWQEAVVGLPTPIPDGLWLTAQAGVPVWSSGPVGPEGPPGPTGPQGPQGPAGTGINLKGQVPNSGALPPSGNNVGDAIDVHEVDRPRMSEAIERVREFAASRTRKKVT